MSETTADFDVVALGAMTTDISFTLPFLPSEGQLVYGSSYLVDAGGMAPNQAAMSRLLGSRVAIIARRSTDLFGLNYSRRLAEADIALIEPSGPPDQQSTVAIVSHVDSGAESLLIVEPAVKIAPQDLLTSPDVSAALTKTRVLLLSLVLPLDTILVALTSARRHGVVCILNPAPRSLSRQDVDRLHAALNSCILCANEAELAWMFGRQEAEMGDQDVGKFLRRLRDQDGCSAAVVTRGRKGAVLCGEDGRCEVVTAPDVEAVECVGAGDCFLGSLAHFLAQDGRGVVDIMMVKKAVYLAALSVTRRGTQRSFPRGEEIEAVLREMPQEDSEECL